MLAKLRHLCPPPVDAHSRSGDWKAVEEELELFLPDDYKAFIGEYGDCMVGDLCIANPFSPPRERFNLVNFRNTTYREYADAISRWDEALPLDIFQDKNRFLPWGSDGNGMDFHWVIDGPSNSWCVASATICDFDPPHVFSDMNFSHFLLAAVDRTLDKYYFLEGLYDPPCSRSMPDISNYYEHRVVGDHLWRVRQFEKKFFFGLVPRHGGDEIEVEISAVESGNLKESRINPEDLLSRYDLT